MSVNKILLIVGESGSGKTAIANKAEDKYGLKAVPSYTTRPPRFENEKGHIFVDEERFDEILSSFNVVGLTEFDRCRYCATELQVEQNDIYVIDVDGLKFFKEKYKGNKKVVVVYIKSPIEVRKSRMESRGDSKEDIYERIRNDEAAFTGAEELADIVIENNKDTDIDVVVKKVWLEFIS